MYTTGVATREFRWNEWNLDNATKHGCSIREIESDVPNASRGFPRDFGDGKRLVIGSRQGGRTIEVIYVIGRDDRIYVIHAMPLTTRRRRGGR